MFTCNTSPEVFRISLKSNSQSGLFLILKVQNVIAYWNSNSSLSKSKNFNDFLEDLPLIIDYILQTPSI